MGYKQRHQIPDLGVGVGFRMPHAEHVLEDGLWATTIDPVLALEEWAARPRATTSPATAAPSMERSSLKIMPPNCNRARHTSCSQKFEKPAGCASSLG